MLVEAGRHGQVTVRRIYGDWTTSNMNSWKETLNYHAFQPIQQFRYTIGKNEFVDGRSYLQPTPYAKELTARG